MGHPWPGNVRELRNAIERAVLLCDDHKLQIKDFSSLIDNVHIKTQEVASLEDIPYNIVRMDVNYGITSLRNVDKEYARKVLFKMGGNKTQTAKILGISRPKLDILLKA
jgi:DNA-binding NtrC family response regulator